MRLLSKRINSFLQSTYPFYAALAVVVAVATYMNFSSETMRGMLHYYITFGDLVKDGLYDSELYRTAGSFPMWGYGFVYAITSNKFIIIVAQELLGLAVVFCVDSYLKKLIRNSRVFTYFRIILLLSFPYFFFHAVLWPYSFSSSFLIIGIYFLVRFLEGQETRANPVWLLFSSASIGISLNFRSDYLLCIIGIYLVLIIVKILTKKRFIPDILYLSGWLLIILAFLAPWAIYTKKVTNHYLVNSTNAGHVLYIGLGQLPGNKWKIVPYDDDSTMHALIVTKLPGVDFSTTTYQSDSLLKKEWMKKVTGDPAEYFKKCGYVFLSVFVQPFSEGDGFKQSLTPNDLSQIREDMRTMHFADLYTFFKKKVSFALVISVLTAFFGIIIHLAFWYYLVINFRNLAKLVKENWMLPISLLVIFYQIALLTAGYYHRNYNTNIYLLYITVLLILYHNSAKLRNEISGKKVASSEIR